MLKGQAVKRLGKKAKKGFRGYPVATIAFYGPDNRTATKVAVAIAAEQDPCGDGCPTTAMDPQIAAEILTFLDGAGVKPWLIGSSAARTRRASTTRDRPARGTGPAGTGREAPLYPSRDHVRCAARFPTTALSSSSRSFDHRRPPSAERTAI